MTLLQQILRTGPLAAEATFRLAAETAVGLAEIHRAGAGHGHLTPAVVVLTDRGAVLAAAPTTSAGPAVPAYAAPEQLDGRPAGKEGDVFAWGATIAFAASGRPPFGEGTAEEVLARVRRDEPELDGLPPALHAIVASCLAPDPRLRPAAADLAARLSGPATPPADAEPARTGQHMAPPMTNLIRPPAQRQRKAIPSKSVLIAAGLVAALVLGVGTAGLTFKGDLVGGNEDSGGEAQSPQPSGPAPTTTPPPGQGSGRPTQTAPPPGGQESSAPPSTLPQPRRPSYAQVDGPGGSSLEIPSGASRQVANEQTYVWLDKQSGATMQVDTKPWGTTDPVERWMRFEHTSQVHDLMRMSLSGRFSYKGWPAADYEFTFTRDGQRARGYGRSFPAGGKQFTVFLSGPADRWDDIKQYLPRMWQSFDA